MSVPTGRWPRKRGKNTTLVATITRKAGTGKTVVVEGATDAKAVEAYIEHFLSTLL